jgi:hypothetical protein
MHHDSRLWWRNDEFCDFVFCCVQLLKVMSRIVEFGEKTYMIFRVTINKIMMEKVLQE